jgi:hypothetical protein
MLRVFSLTLLSRTYSTASEPPLWQPLPELTPPEYSTVTIMFISSLRILYEKWSDDPIFPADRAWSVSRDSKRWFRNSDPRARPLACINTIETRAVDGTRWWSIRAPDSITNLEWTPEYTLMYTSLYHTDIYDSIKKRLGRGLLAQKLVSGYFSDALTNYHWVDEIENMVKIAHARTQINAWSVASGEDFIHEGKDGYYPITEEYGDLCGKYKFNPQGYASFNLATFIITILSWPVLCILTLDWKPVENTLINCFTHVKSVCNNTMAKLRASRSYSRQDRGGQSPIGSVDPLDPDPLDQTLDEGSSASPLAKLPKMAATLNTDLGGSTGSETTRQAPPPLAESSEMGATRSQVRSSSQSESRVEIRTEREERSVTDEGTTTPDRSTQARSERKFQKKAIAKSPATETPSFSDDALIEWEPLLYWGVICWLFWFLRTIIFIPINLVMVCGTHIWTFVRATG